MKSTNSAFILQEQYKHLSRLFRQFDMLEKLKREAAEQQDRIAAEIEQQRTAIALTKMDRSILPIVPIKMEIL